MNCQSNHPLNLISSFQNLNCNSMSVPDIQLESSFNSAFGGSTIILHFCLNLICFSFNRKPSMGSIFRALNRHLLL